MSIELRTNRLTLRPPIRADFDAFAAMWAEPGVNKYITGMPQTRADSLGRFQRVVGGWALSGFGFFSVFDRAGSYLGQTGLFEAIRDLGPTFDGLPEAGWVFSEAAAGQGYATEATLAAHKWFDAQRFAQRSVCMIAPEHAVSICVAAKCGYEAMEQGVYAGDPVLLMARACA